MKTNLDTLERLISSANLLDQLSNHNLAFAHGDMAHWLRLTSKYERKSRLQSKGAKRLRQRAIKVCDQIKNNLSGGIENTKSVREAVLPAQNSLSFTESAADYYDHTLFSKEADELFEHQPVPEDSLMQ